MRKGGKTGGRKADEVGREDGRKERSGRGHRVMAGQKSMAYATEGVQHTSMHQVGHAVHVKALLALCYVAQQIFQSAQMQYHAIQYQFSITMGKFIWQQ